MLKIFKIVLIGIFLLNTLAPSQAWATGRKKHRSPQVKVFSAKSALLWNITTDKVYFSKNPEHMIYPASTTKVMTVLLTLEKLSLDQYVTVSARAAEVQPTNLGFKSGEQYLVRDLIYACLLKSANDAAGVLAEAVGGTQANFVDMMNKKAAHLGANNTLFANPHGLPSTSKQYTTAKDMAIIFKAALKNPFFEQAISYRYRIIYSKDGRRHFLKTHNKSLFLNWKQDVYGKTGYTLQAQACFVGYFKRGNDVFIVDVFGCRNRKRWGDIQWMIERYSGVKL